MYCFHFRKPGPLSMERWVLWTRCPTASLYKSFKCFVQRTATQSKTNELLKCLPFAQKWYRAQSIFHWTSTWFRYDFFSTFPRLPRAYLQSSSKRTKSTFPCFCSDHGLWWKRKVNAGYPLTGFFNFCWPLPVEPMLIKALPHPFLARTSRAGRTKFQKR